MKNNNYRVFITPRSWDDLKIQLAKIFKNLTPEDLDFKEERKDEMLTKLQLKLGKTKEQLTSILEVI